MELFFIEDNRGKPEAEKDRLRNEALRQYKVLRIIDTMGLGAGWESSSWDKLQKIASNKNNFIIVMQVGRVGVTQAMSDVEEKLYPPATERNKLFQVFWCLWREMLFFVAVVPRKDRNQITRIVTESGMHLADGLPLLIESTGKHPFPLNYEKWIVTMENQPDHAVYGKPPGDVMDMLEDEGQHLLRYYDKKERARFWEKRGKPKPWMEN